MNPFVQPKPMKPKGTNPSGMKSMPGGAYAPASEPDEDDTAVNAPSDGDMDNVQGGKTKSMIKKYLMARAKKRKKS